jgi:pimeloyl-ACP methyl ester carboxylesterase
MSTWILVRGLTRESGHWSAFAREFSAALGVERAVMLDLPGNGALYRRTSPASVERLVEESRAELARRKVAPPFSMLALSLGAMVAVAWASAWPQEVQRCVLINTSLRPFCPFYWRLRPASYLNLLRVLFAANAEERERRVLRMTSSKATANADVIGDWIALWRAHPVSRGNALRQLLAGIRYRAPAVRPQAKLLLLASAGDRLVDVRCSRGLASAWQGALAEHPGAGHDLPLDDPAWVIEQVRAWV